MRCLVDNRLIGLVGREFDNGPGDLRSIPYQRLLKMVLDTSMLNSQQYKVRVKGKVEESRESSCALPYTSVQQILKREPSGCPRLLRFGGWFCLLLSQFGVRASRLNVHLFSEISRMNVTFSKKKKRMQSFYGKFSISFTLLCCSIVDYCFNPKI